jgi:chromate transporter
MGAVAAGLIIGTALKLASALGSNPMGVRVCALAGVAVFVAVALLRLPLVWVLIVLGSLATAFAWARLRPGDSGSG